MITLNFLIISAILVNLTHIIRKSIKPRTNKGNILMSFVVLIYLSYYLGLIVITIIQMYKSGGYLPL